MTHLLRNAVLVASLAASVPAHAQTPKGGATIAPPRAVPTPQPCVLDYQRADNMMAATGRPDGSLGTETVTVKAGETRIFTTDWKYEKQRNDGRNYYGSHLRVTFNKGRPVRLTVRSAPLSPGLPVVLPAWKRQEFKADLMEVSCPAR
jgi:hypothetical protein